MHKVEWKLEKKKKPQEGSPGAKVARCYKQNASAVETREDEKNEAAVVFDKRYITSSHNVLLIVIFDRRLFRSS